MKSASRFQPFLAPLSVALLSCLATHAHAAAFAQLHQTLDVSGQLQLPTGAREARQVRVDLETDGRAFVRFEHQRSDDWDNWSSNRSTDRSNWSSGEAAFTGIWHGAGDRVTVDLREGLGRQTVFGEMNLDLKNGNGFRGAPKCARFRSMAAF